MKQEHDLENIQNLGRKMEEDADYREPTLEEKFKIRIKYIGVWSFIGILLGAWLGAAIEQILGGIFIGVIFGTAVGAVTQTQGTENTNIESKRQLANILLVIMGTLIFVFIVGLVFFSYMRSMTL